MKCSYIAPGHHVTTVKLLYDSKCHIAAQRGAVKKVTNIKKCRIPNSFIK